MRVSLFGTYREKYKQAYAFRPGAYDPTAIGLNLADGSVTGNPFTGLVQCGGPGIPAGCLSGHLFNPAPRVGFAYDPVGDGKTSIRGGYGIFFEHTNGNEGNTESLEGSAPLVQNTSVFNVPNYTSIAGTSAGAPGPLNVFSLPTKAIWPYVQQWNFSVQRELPSHTLVTAAYAGSKGTHLTDQRALNQLLPTSASQNPYLPGQAVDTTNDCSSLSVNGQPVTGQALNNLQVACGVNPNLFRPFQGFGNVTLLEDQANSIYNSMQISARRNVGRLTLSLAYTWSHSIDDSSDRSDGTFVNSYDLRSARASSNFDQRQLLNISYVYDLPFFTSPGILHTVLGGWQWSGLVLHETGTPFTITNGAVGDNAGVANNLGSGSYVDVVGSPTANVSNGQVTGAGPLLYNPAAFAEPTGLTFGNSGRNSLTNPARTNFDMGLFKRFPLRSESRSIEFRAEAFNVFNHTQWLALNDPNANSNDHTAPCSGVCVDNGIFLRPTGAHNPRILQLGLKFLF